jgi:hypothetical protein
MASCWVARSHSDEYLGTFRSQRAARRAIERHLEGAGLGKPLARRCGGAPAAITLSVVTV